MSGWRVVGFSLVSFGVIGAVACSPDERRFSGVPEFQRGNPYEQFTADEEVGGAGPVLGGMGGASYRNPETCGDGQWQREEVCDPTVEGFETCEDLGFDSGSTSCSSSCALDVSACRYAQGPTQLEICGDGFIDNDEECDDGGREDGDGCSAECGIESTEHEPNDNEDEAEDYLPGVPFFGMLESGGEDWLRVTVEEPPAQLVASVSDLIRNGCSDAIPGMNPAVELIDAYGDPIAWDSDGGQGECALLEVSDLTAGFYYLRVTGEMSGTFPYVLDVAVQ